MEPGPEKNRGMPLRIFSVFFLLFPMPFSFLTPALRRPDKTAEFARTVRQEGDLVAAEAIRCTRRVQSQKAFLLIFFSLIIRQ